MKPARIHQLSREELAKEQIGRTEISRPVAVVLSALFVAAILAWPAVQIAQEFQPGATVEVLRHPPVWDSLRRMPAHWARLEGRGWLGRLLVVNADVLRGIQETENELDASSWLTVAAQPGYQAVLYRWLGVGNEQAYAGREGWLFFRPEIDYLTGPGFLDERQLKRRAAEGSEWRAPPQPDPLRAIRAFHRELGERGIDLIVLPVPAKPGIHPGYFHEAYSGAEEPLQNPSFRDWVRRLEDEGIRVIDPGPALVAAARAEGRPQFLATDTHWRPEAMDRVARMLAVEIESLPAWPGRQKDYRRETLPITNPGDTAQMLSLPPAVRPPPETVEILRVLTDRRELWRPAADSPVLLLGDSFSNIYSLPAMGWGDSAGLAEQISYYLGMPVDRLVRNDDGAWATRHMLARELALGRDRLAGKRVVIWQFAARELAIGDWRDIPLEIGQPPQRSFLALESGRRLVLTGRVASASAVPVPGSVPYRDHVVSWHLVDIEGLPEGQADLAQAVVYLRSMADNVLQPAAFVRAGQAVVLDVSAWADVADEMDAINRSELDDWELQMQEPLWGEWPGE